MPHAHSNIADGRRFTNRFQGEFRVSLKTLESDIAGGCYNDSHLTLPTSATLTVQKSAPAERESAILDLLKKHGWPESRITLKRSR